MISSRWPGWMTTLLVAGLFWQSLACSSNEPRYPEDHARFLRIDAAVERLRTAYVEQNLAEIRDVMLPFDRLDQMSDDIEQDFETFDSIELDLSVDRIMLDSETIDVFVRWQGQWRRGPTDPGIRERGHGMLRWVGVQSILLKNVDGDLPFGMATRIHQSSPRTIP